MFYLPTFSSFGGKGNAHIFVYSSEEEKKKRTDN